MNEKGWLDRWRLADLLLKLPLVEARFVRSDTAIEISDVAPAAYATVALKAANDRFVSAEREKRGELIARAEKIDPWEKFGLIRLRDCRISLRANANGQFVTAEIDRACELVANRPVILGWESFEILPQPNGDVAFRAFNGGFVGARLDSIGEITASAPAIREWELFKVQLLA
jgi:hypothetical protein